MKTCENLPEGYRSAFTVNLQKDKKLAWRVNLGGALILVVLVVGMSFFRSPAELFDMSQGFGRYTLRVVALLAGSFAYIILHEAVHGIVMKAYGCKRVRFGYTGLYAYAGSEEFFGKKAYLVIALAPVVFWGIILAVLNGIVPNDWFWVVYWIQISNLSGAAGDLYVTAKFCHLPADIYVKDTGVEMTVYTKEE